MIEKLYRLLWSHLGGRPWTYIIIDASDKYTLLFLAGAFLLGERLAPWWTLRDWGVFVVGLLCGHFWWRTTYGGK